MEKKISDMDVFVCRGIWYIMTLLSLFGLSKSLNLLWPPGDSSSQSFRDGAVSVTTFYAVTLLRYLFFTAPPSACYKEFTTKLERVPQVLFSTFSANLALALPLIYELLTNKEFELSMSLFTISLFTGGLGLIQLSDKFRMEIGHALYTLFLGWLSCLFSMSNNLYRGDYKVLLLFLISVPHFLLSFGPAYNFSKWEDSDTFSAYRAIEDKLDTHAMTTLSI